jgi:hypothetical protein
MLECEAKLNKQTKMKTKCCKYSTCSDKRYTFPGRVQGQLLGEHPHPGRERQRAEI